ncbi:MAG: Arc family DNA-binding protein [Acidobacteriia bacterium]|nr:Arc family DNA-binding protein [Terriglobia bacterium]
MPTLTIKKLPARLHTRLKRQAAAHRRSINSEAIECLEKALSEPALDPEAFLAHIRARRERNRNIYATERSLRAARNWGRK